MGDLFHSSSLLLFGLPKMEDGFNGMGPDASCGMAFQAMNKPTSFAVRAIEPRMGLESQTDNPEPTSVRSRRFGYSAASYNLDITFGSVLLRGRSTREEQHPRAMPPYNFAADC